jgi:hypothetical protein
MRRFYATFSTMAILCAGLAMPVLAADPTVEEKVVAPGDAMYILAPKGARVAAIANSGSRMVVKVDDLEGPKLDQMLGPDGRPVAGQPNMFFTGDASPVVFSEDGQHYAYAGRIGSEAVIFHDGKEIARAPFNASVLSFGPLSFSPGGKHLYYAIYDQVGGKQTLYLDGKPMPFPSINSPAAMLFSPDDLHHVYFGRDASKPDPNVLVVDGKPVDYMIDEPLFSADGHLYGLGTVNNERALLKDGKPAVTGQIQRYILSKQGDTVITVLTRPNPGGQLYFLNVNGQKIDASECINGIDKIVLSPDGKRYAARCRNQTSMFMVIDGKKELEYNGIGDEMNFTADSTKFAYHASNGTRAFIITNGEESKPYTNILTRPMFSPTGAHIAYVAGENRLDCRVVVDGKELAPQRDVMVFKFNQDGSRYAFNSGMMSSAVFVDGAQLPGALSGDFDFTPDGKNFVYYGQKASVNGIYINNDLAFVQRGRFIRKAFTPDGKHLYFAMVNVENGQRIGRVYLNGKPVATFGADANGALEQMNEVWEIAPDGTMSMIFLAEEGIKRIKVTPAADTSLLSMVDEMKAAEAKAAEDAAAAKKAAEEAAAKLKADQEAARAKAIADQQAAREAALKARQEAQQAAQQARQRAAEEAAARRAAGRRGTAP